MRHVGLVAAMALLMGAGCGSTPPREPVGAAVKPKQAAPTARLTADSFAHEDPNLAYALTLPKAWRISDAPPDGKTVILFRRGPQDSLTVMAEQADETALATHVAQRRQLLKTAGLDASAPEALRLAGEAALRIDIQIPFAGRIAHAVRYFVRRGDVLLVFQLRTDAPDPSALPLLISEFEQGLRWLPGAPTVVARRFDHPAMQGGGWRVAGEMWWSPTLDVQMDVSPYTLDMRSTNLPPGTLLLANDTTQGTQIEVHSLPYATANGFVFGGQTISVAGASPLPGEGVTVDVLGQPTAFEVYRSKIGLVAVAQVTHHVRPFQLTLQLRGRVNAARLKPILDRLRPLGAQRRAHLEATTGVPERIRLVEGDLMFDQRVLRDRSSGLQWVLPEGAWQAAIGQRATALRRNAHFVALDVDSGIFVVLSETPFATPALWKSTIARVYSGSKPAPPHTVAGQTVAVWRTPNDYMSMPFAFANRYWIAEVAAMHAGGIEWAQRARTAIEGVASLDPAWMLSKRAQSIVEPFYGLKVELPAGVLPHPHLPGTQVVPNEFIQFIAGPGGPVGGIKAMALPGRRVARSASEALMDHTLKNGFVEEARGALMLGRHRLEVRTGRNPILTLAGRAVRFGTAYANGIALMINHVGTEAEWKALLDGIEFMPE